MRNYPRNSPESAARIVALVLISDGHACRSELDVVENANVFVELGLEPSTFRDVLQTLCEDLMLGASNGSMLSGIDADGLRSVMAEIDDEILQRKVLNLSMAVAAADAYLAGGETVVLDAARQHWHLGKRSGAETPGAA